MENQLMLIYNSIVISWFAFFVTVACVVGTVTACILRFFQKKPVSDIFVLSTFAVPLGLLLSRINYCMFSYESINGLSDFLSITNGGFGLYGAFAGVCLAALIACVVFGAEDLGGLLDCVATGGALAVTIGRFATRFTTAEVGYPVSFRLFTVFDSSQNVYNLAVYELDGIYEACVFVTCVWFFVYTLSKKASSGKTALLMLALHGTNQVIMDSMRSDPLKLGINNFIKTSQIIGILCCISVLVYFMVISAKAKGFGKYHIFSIPIILISIVMGVIGEYRVGDSDYITKHLLMFAGMMALNWLTVDFALKCVSAESSAPAKNSSQVHRKQPERQVQQEPAEEEPQDPWDSPRLHEKCGYPERRRPDDERPRRSAFPVAAAPSQRPEERRNTSSDSPSVPEQVPTGRTRTFNRHRRDSRDISSANPATPTEESKRSDIRHAGNTGKPSAGQKPEPIVSSDSGSYNPDIHIGNFNF